MIWPVFKKMLREQFRMKSFLPWVFAALFVVVVSRVWFTIQTNSTSLEVYSLMESILVFKLTVLACIIASLSIVSAEVDQKTIVYLLTRPIVRRDLLLGKYAAVAMFVFIVGVLMTIAAGCACLGGGYFSNAIFLRDLLSLALLSLSYNGLFLLVSLIFNRSMIYTLIFAFGWESAVPNLPGNVSYSSLSTYVQAVAQHPGSDAQDVIQKLAGIISKTSISATVGIIALLAIAAVTVAVSVAIFTYAEFVPREDAA